MIVLLDTNILLDCLQARKPHDAAATQTWKLVEERALVGFVSAISFNNIFYVARKQVGSERALDAVKLVRKSFQLVPLDEAILDQAITASTGDLEAAIQVAAALRVNADYIVTRNTSDFRRLGVPAVTAEELLAILHT